MPGFRLSFLCRLRLLRRLDDGRQQVELDDGQRRGGFLRGFLCYLQRRYALSAKYPHYSAQETQGKINHFLESDTKPMICRMIAQKGFVCPRLANGSCACNAPAALCYQPLDVDTLRELLAEEPVTGKTVEDALSAQRFIKGYLYNVDSVLAGTFLQYELRQRFGLNAMDMKPLEALQKELYRAWKSAKDTKREAGRNELPDWYELTENGGLRFLSGILADHMSKEVATFYGAGSFYAYESGVYGAKDDLWAANKVREHMLARSTVLNAINDTTEQWKMLINRSMRDINPNSFIVNLRNGLYNLLDGSFREHTPEYLSTVQIGAAHRPELLYVADNGCPIFQAFLCSALNEPEIGLM